MCLRLQASGPIAVRAQDWLIWFFVCFFRGTASSHPIVLDAFSRDRSVSDFSGARASIPCQCVEMIISQCACEHIQWLDGTVRAFAMGVAEIALRMPKISTDVGIVPVLSVLSRGVPRYPYVARISARAH